MAKRYQMA